MESFKIEGDEPISWDECFMRIAHTISMRSRDPSTKNGAVVVNQNKVVVGLGYNGFPRGVDDTKLPWEREGEFGETKYAYVVHAEENAVYNSNANTEGCSLYCTLFPCNECAKTIIQNGITEVIYESDKYHDDKVWVAARKLFDMAGVKYRQFNANGGEQTPYSGSIKIKIKRMHQDAIVPNYAYENDAGMDLYAIEDAEIPAGSRAKIGTGIAIELPQGFASLIWDKSGVSVKKGLKTLGGVIDSGYRGEYFVSLANISKEPVSILKGEKVAQLLIQKVEQAQIEVSDELSDSERGEKGFGSTDLKKIDPIEDSGFDYIPSEEIEEEIEIEEVREGQDGISRW